MTRRAIRRDEEQAIRGRVAKALGRRPNDVNTGADDDDIDLIEVMSPARCGLRGLSASELAKLAAVGIHPGADGWEIEEEAPAVKVGDLFRRPDGPPAWCAAEVTGSGAGGPRWRLSMPGVPGSIFEEERDLLDPARWTREAPAIARPPLLPGFGWYEHGIESYGLDEATENGRTIARVRRNPQGTGWLWALERSGAAWTLAESLPEAKNCAEDTCRAAGLFDAPTAPYLGAKVDAIHAAAGTPPTGAARALLRLALRLLGRAETGEYIVGDPQLYPAELAPLSRLCEAFVAELRASLPAPPMPTPRTTDGALTAYLLEHHRAAWRPGEDALALAIRLLGEASDTIADAREEARVADENAKELELELRKVRGLLRGARSERDEARADLATVRASVLADAHALAAKMGAPHG